MPAPRLAALRRPAPATLANAYVAAVTLAGAAVLALLGRGALDAVVDHPQIGVVALALGIVVGELVPIKLGPTDGEVAPSTTFTYALLLVAGPGVAAVVQVLATTLADVVHTKRVSRWAFNVAQYVLAVGAAGAVIELVAERPAGGAITPLQLAGVLLAAVTFFVVNTGAVAVAIALHQGHRLRDELRGNLTRQSATEAILLGFAPLAALTAQHSPLLLPLLTLPLMAVQRAGRHAQLSQRLALHDALTGLPNRVLFQKRLDEALAVRDEDDDVLVMLLDLDRFKEINDTLGHHYGDEVLRHMAGRLSALVRPGDTVARLGGDEFAIVLTAGSGHTDAWAIAMRVREALAEPFDVAGVRLDMDGSIGIAKAPGDGVDAQALLRRADVAMYQAKAGGTGVERYAAEHDEHSVKRLALAGDLRRALEGGEFAPHFQPKIDLASGEIRGVEALLRWTRRDGTPVEPSVFIEVAEQTGFIVPLTAHVLEESLRACGAWRAAGRELSVSVNLSARTLLERTLPVRVAALCVQHRVPTSALTLEITENMVVADPDRALPVLEALAALGVRIAIDDFGTGFSSLEYLKLLPVDELKVDRTFVMGMDDDVRDAQIVRCAVQLAQSLGIRVTAEGVESEAIHDALVALGCDEAQGFFYGRAVPDDELRRMVAAGPVVAPGAALRAVA
jgi:diguanylate cyclase (GGDEF)-like protein